MRQCLKPPRGGLHLSFPTIAEAVRGESVDRAFIDGEAVVLTGDGRSGFGAPAVWSGHRGRRLRMQPPFTARAIRCAVDDGRARSRRTVDGRSSSSGGEGAVRATADRLRLVLHADRNGHYAARARHSVNAAERLCL
jgi:hypothetical protein